MTLAVAVGKLVKILAEDDWNNARWRIIILSFLQIAACTWTTARGWTERTYKSTRSTHRIYHAAETKHRTCRTAATATRSHLRTFAARSRRIEVHSGGYYPNLLNMVRIMGGRKR
jgi:hypothetical protein